MMANGSQPPALAPAPASPPVPSPRPPPAPSPPVSAPVPVLVPTPNSSLAPSSTLAPLSPSAPDPALAPASAPPSPVASPPTMSPAPARQHVATQTQGPTCCAAVMSRLQAVERELERTQERLREALGSRPAVSLGGIRPKSATTSPAAEELWTQIERKQVGAEPPAGPGVDSCREGTECGLQTCSPRLSGDCLTNSCEEAFVTNTEQLVVKEEPVCFDTQWLPGSAEAEEEAESDKDFCLDDSGGEEGVGELVAWHRPELTLSPTPCTSLAAQEQVVDMEIKDEDGDFNEEVQLLPSYLLESSESLEGPAKQGPEGSETGADAEDMNLSGEFEKSDYDPYLSDGASDADFPKKEGNKGRKSVGCICWQCAEPFNSYAQLERHAAVDHPGTGAHLCSRCSGTFATIGGLRIHTRSTHLKERPYVCKTCNINFAFKQGLRRHEWKIHKRQETPDFKIPTSWSCSCPICPKVYKNTAHTRRHFYDVHMQEQKYACGRCGEEFNNRAKLYFHQKTHTDTDTTTALPQMQNTSGQEQTKIQGMSACRCPHCGKNFCSPANALRHMRFNHPEQSSLLCKRPVRSCTLQQDSGQSMALTAKQTVPSRQGLGGCPSSACLVCGKSFSVFSNLLRHTAMAHGRESHHKLLAMQSTQAATAARKEKSSEAQDKGREMSVTHLYTCSVCNFRFYTSAKLRKHNLLHSEARPHCCSVCGWRFRMETHLKNHMQRHRPGSQVPRRSESMQLAVKQEPVISGTEPVLLPPGDVVAEAEAEAESEEDVCVDDLGSEDRDGGLESALPTAPAPVAQEQDMHLDQDANGEIHCEPECTAWLEGPALAAIKQEPQESDAEAEAEDIDPSGEFEESDYDPYLSDWASDADYAKEKEGRKDHHRSVSCSCWQCSQHFSSYSKLQQHTAKEHPGTWAHLCPQCGKSFSLAGTLQRHIRNIHLQEKPHVCNICGIRFALRYILKDHEKRLHRKTHVANRAVPDSWSRRCPRCPKVFSTAACTRRHFNTAHLNKQQYACDRCGETFQGRSKLYFHQKTHSDKDTIKALSLPQMQPGPKQAKVKGDSACRCPHCGKNFSNRRNAMNHIRFTHPKQRTTQRETQTRSCTLQKPSGQGMASTAKQPLDTRQELVGSLPSACLVCGKTFPIFANLLQHTSKAHGRKHHDTLLAMKSLHVATARKEELSDGKDMRGKASVKQGVLQKQNVCSVCNFRFSSPSKLQRHIPMHSKARPLCCSVCGWRFQLEYHLRIHLRRHRSTTKSSGHKQCLGPQLSVKLERMRSDTQPAQQPPGAADVEAKTEDNAHVHESSDEGAARELVACHQSESALSTPLASAVKEQDLNVVQGGNGEVRRKATSLPEGSGWLEGPALAAIKQEPQESDAGAEAEDIDPSGEFEECDYDPYLSDRASDADYGKEKEQGKKVPGSVSCICWQCSKHFNSHTQLQKHTGKEHPGTGAHQCTKCHKTFSVMGSLQNHIRSIHLTEKPYVCNSCGLRFSLKYSLRKHEWRMHRRKQLGNSAVPGSWSRRCPRCPKVFRTATSTRRHFNSAHLNKQRYTCYTCGAAFQDRAKLYLHQKSHPDEDKAKALPQLQAQPQKNPGEEEAKVRSVNAYCCPLCSKNFSTPSNVQRHIRLNHRKQMSLLHQAPVQSSALQEQSGQSAGSTAKHPLLSHLELGGNLPSDCVVCGKTFSAFPNLLRHTSTVHGRRHYLALLEMHTTAGKKGPSNGKKVSGKVSANRWHLCSVCNIRCSTAAKLRKHSSVHSQARPHCCPVCGWRFQLEGHLKRHMQRHLHAAVKASKRSNGTAQVANMDEVVNGEIHLEPTSLPEGSGCRWLEGPALAAFKQEPKESDAGAEAEHIDPSGNRSVSCWQCSEQFSSYSEQQKHAAKEHPGTRAHTCTQCSRTFPRQQNLNRHISNVHLKEKPHACSTCGMQFGYRHTLKDHERRFHKKKPLAQSAVPASWSRRCPRCPKVFSNANSTRRHFNSAHLNNQQYTCHTCGKAFQDRAKLNSHQETHSDTDRTKALTETQKMFGQEQAKLQGVRTCCCPHCDKNFTTHGSVLRHVRLMHGKQRALLRQAPDNQSGELQLHSDQSTALRAKPPLPGNLELGGSMPSACLVCGKMFPTFANLLRHTARAHGAKHHRALLAMRSPQMTAATRKKVKGEASLKRWHTCSVCNIRFYTSANLRKHSLLHSEARPHCCSVCGWRFRMETHLKNHMQRHQSAAKASERSNGTAQPSAEKQPVSCDAQPAQLPYGIAESEAEPEGDVRMDDSSGEDGARVLATCHRLETVPSLAPTPTLGTQEQDMHLVQDVNGENRLKVMSLPEGSAWLEGVALAAIKLEPEESDAGVSSGDLEPSGDFAESNHNH